MYLDLDRNVRGDQRATGTRLGFVIGSDFNGNSVLDVTAVRADIDRLDLELSTASLDFNVSWLIKLGWTEGMTQRKCGRLGSESWA